MKPSTTKPSTTVQVPPSDPKSNVAAEPEQIPALIMVPTGADQRSPAHIPSGNPADPKVREIERQSSEQQDNRTSILRTSILRAQVPSATTPAASGPRSSTPVNPASIAEVSAPGNSESQSNPEHRRAEQEAEVLKLLWRLRGNREPEADLLPELRSLTRNVPIESLLERLRHLATVNFTLTPGEITARIRQALGLG